MGGAGRKPQVVVVGAGIVGASIAVNLSRREVDLTVLDAGVPGSGASGHSFAWLNSFGKEPDFYHRLNRRSIDIWDRFARRLSGDIGLRWGGELRWVATDEEAHELRDRVAQLQRWGYPSRTLREAELRELEPGLSPGPVAAASFSDIDGHVDAPRVARACLEQAERRGASVHTGTAATGLRLGGGSGGTDHAAAVEVSGGEFPCDVVVLAVGVNTTELAGSVGVRVPGQESPGVVIRTEPVPQVLGRVSVLHTPPSGEEPGIHLRQLADGTLMLGEGSQERPETDDSQRHADDVVARAARYLPTIGKPRAIPVPVGYRPMPLDGLPVLGFTEPVPNLYVAMTHSGVTLAPLIGELATIEIVDGGKVEVLDAYRPERFA